ncbi:MAG: GntR family transcriptional regulator [Methylococcales bacterium]|jgi:uncharacterized protein|nr:GntR family transcriptional regulator [Methylococcales bacterium]MBT7442812.1 GntR family transcriptional regulator [Methylococcales bacterium]
MAIVGQLQTLTVVKLVSFGAFLDGGEQGEILIPQRYIENDLNVDDEIEVFVYTDSEDRLIATTERPYAYVGDFAYLKVVESSKFGSFLDWGLPKDLLLPYSEQHHKVTDGQSYIVRLYLDESSQRVAASSRIDRFLDIEPIEYEVGEQVDLMIAEQTDMGYKAIINGKHWGLIFENEIFTQLYKGSRCQGYVKRIRPDNKIDLSLNKVGKAKLDDLESKIIQKLIANDGFIAMTDKSPPKAIYALFGVSKKAYKKTVGILYKSQKITLEDNGIRLVTGQTVNPWQEQAATPSEKQTPNPWQKSKHNK